MREKERKKERLDLTSVIAKFAFEVVFAPEGKDSKDMCNQHKRKTILRSEHYFPYLKVRSKVVETQVVHAWMGYLLDCHHFFKKSSYSLLNHPCLDHTRPTGPCTGNHGPQELPAECRISARFSEPENIANRFAGLTSFAYVCSAMFVSRC